MMAKTQESRHFGIMRMLITMAAFTGGQWNFRAGAVGPVQLTGNPFYSPKRTKLKGWQKAARK